MSYTGTSKGNVGVNDLIILRLQILCHGLEPHERLVSLQFDKMQIKKALVYVRTRQQFCGYVDYGGVDVSTANSSGIRQGVQPADGKSNEGVFNPK